MGQGLVRLFMLCGSFPKVIFCLSKQLSCQSVKLDLNTFKLNCKNSHLKFYSLRRHKRKEKHRHEMILMCQFKAICHWPTGISIWTNKIMGLRAKKAAVSVHRVIRLLSTTTIKCLAVIHFK